MWRRIIALKGALSQFISEWRAFIDFVVAFIGKIGFVSAH
jgi:hypothetical protein